MKKLNTGKDLDYNPELREIRRKLELIHKDVKRMMENSNQNHLDLMLANLKKDILNSVTSYINEDIETRLENGMVEECTMRSTCKSKFKGFLNGNMTLLTQDNVPESTIKNRIAELIEMKEDAPFEKCEDCFFEVSTLFDKQLKLMRSLQIYRSSKGEKLETCTISEEFIVKDVLEPLSNQQRLQILKDMVSESKTFSDLSELTGLRGGNLLFHIQKLLDKDMILQRHERGDYMITSKGFNLLKLISEIQHKT